MRNISDEEKKRLYAEMQKRLDDQMLQAIKNGYTGTSLSSYGVPTAYLQSTPSHPRNSYNGVGMVSPTDKNSKGVYPYQEPEVDEQGTFYGYKILHRNPRNGCQCEQCQSLVSPRHFVRWINGELQAHEEPSAGTMSGIHCTKRPDHPALQDYVVNEIAYTFSWMDREDFETRKSLLVRCALSGTIVETEQGFRAEHAQIVGVYQDGNWRSYQDYQERPRPDYRPYSEFAWEEAEEWRYRNGTPSSFWKAIDPPDTNP